MASSPAAAALAAVRDGAVLVDVRSAAEYQTRHIDTAFSLPLGAALDASIAETEAGGGALRQVSGALKPVVVHCASGARSRTAAEQLAAAGFAVIDLGAMDDWPGEGLPPKPSKQVKCRGCGAVMPDSEFQAHCGEVEHDDDFMYDCDPIDPPAQQPEVRPEAEPEAKVALGLPPFGDPPLPAAVGKATLPRVPVENPCRNWQYKWPVPCDRLCCHTHPSNCPCADIACDACHYSLVRPAGATPANMNGLEPMTRYVCMDCSVDPDYDDSHWSTQLCQTCFDSPAAAPHFSGPDSTGELAKNWLRVSSTGEHTPATRVVDGMTAVEITAANLTTYPVADDEDGADCTACYCFDISQENPRAALPGCTAEAHRCCVKGCIARLKSSGKILCVLETTYWLKKAERTEFYHICIDRLLR
jgi:rhodanese-related sulfurtransferase